MFSENNLGKDYFSISKHELRLHVCNNERDFDKNLRSKLAEFCIQYYINERRNMMDHSFVNISRIKKFKDLCNEDIVGRHFSITDIIKKFNFLSEQEDPFIDALETLSNYKKYYLAIIIIFSLLGNCLTAIVLFRRKISSSNMYLCVLTMSDIAYAMILFVQWLLLMDIRPKENDLFWLKIFMNFLSFISEFLSVWLIVVFTIERCIVTKYPLQRRSWCTVKRAKIVVITLMGLAILRSIVHIFAIFVHINNNDKIYSKDVINIYDIKDVINIYDLHKHQKVDVQKEITRTRNIINSIIIFTLPALVIVICNTLTGYNIYQQNRVRKTLMIAFNSSNERTQTSSHKILQNKITKMLILVSSIFVILKLPAQYIFYISYFPEYVNVSVMYIISDLLDTAHYGINFVLYCATGRTFRRELIRIFIELINIKKNRKIMEMDSYK